MPSSSDLNHQPEEYSTQPRRSSPYSPRSTTDSSTPASNGEASYRGGVKSQRRKQPFPTTASSTHQTIPKQKLVPSSIGDTASDQSIKGEVTPAKAWRSSRFPSEDVSHNTDSLSSSPPGFIPQTYGNALHRGDELDVSSTTEVQRSMQDNLNRYSASPSAQGRNHQLPRSHLKAHFPDMAGPHTFEANNAGFISPMSPQRLSHSLDSLQSAGGLHPSKAENVLLEGGEGYLDIFRVERRKLELMSHINGVDGTVLSAKVLPCHSRRDELVEFRPLVALIVHGPTTDDLSSMTTEAVLNKPSPSSPAYYHDEDRRNGAVLQTRVDVYSLKTHERITSLYKSPSLSATLNPWTRALSNAPPYGDLSLHTSGNLVAVVAGASGEIFLFAPTKDSNSAEPFRCIGKFWTVVRNISTNNRDESQNEANGTIAENRHQSFAASPCFSLNGRWLALVPPSSQSRNSIQGTVSFSPIDPKPPGVESITAPSPPLVNCELDTPDPESFTNRVARGVAQEVVKGAQWVGSQGWTAWQNYWNKSLRVTPADGLDGYRSQSQFPPTHAEANKMAEPNQESGEFVSVIDLQRLLRPTQGKTRKKSESAATFSPPFGCSFVSFDPSGLHLLTVSNNGDIQHVWDLLQLRPGKKKNPSTYRSATKSSFSGPIVRQVAKFSRFTNAAVVDVVWSEPKGEKLAIITNKGTIHTFRLPASTFFWPPPSLPKPRSFSSTVPQTEKSVEDEVVIENTQLPMQNAGVISSTAASVTGTARPIVARMRERSSSGASSLFSGFGNLNVTSATSLRSSRAVASSLSKSLGAAASSVNKLRKTDDNRFRINVGSGGIRSGCVRFLRGKDRGFLGALSGGMLKFCPLYSVTRSRNSTSRGPRYAAWEESELCLPNSGSQTHSSNFQSNSKPKSFRAAKGADVDQEDIDLNSSKPSHDGGQYEQVASSLHPLAFAEIETCAPFQPFHTDRRVTISVFRESQESCNFGGGLGSAKGESKDVPWGFGGVIETMPLSDVPADRLKSKNFGEAKIASEQTAIEQQHKGQDVDLLEAESCTGITAQPRAEDPSQVSNVPSLEEMHNIEEESPPKKPSKKKHKAHTVFEPFTSSPPPLTPMVEVENLSEVQGTEDPHLSWDDTPQQKIGYSKKSKQAKKGKKSKKPGTSDQHKPAVYFSWEGWGQREPAPKAEDYQGEPDYGDLKDEELLAEAVDWGLDDTKDLEGALELDQEPVSAKENDEYLLRWD